MNSQSNSQLLLSYFKNQFKEKKRKFISEIK